MKGFADGHLEHCWKSLDQSPGTRKPDSVLGLTVE